MSNIVLNTLTYVGTGIINGLSYFWEKSLGIVSGFSALTNRINYTQDRVNVLWKLEVPVLQSEATSCACPGDVLRNTIVNIEVRYDKRATQAERDDIDLRVQNLVTSAQFRASVKSLVLAT